MTPTKKAGTPAKKPARTTTPAEAAAEAADLAASARGESVPRRPGRKAHVLNLAEGGQRLDKIAHLAFLAREADGALRDAVLDALVAGVPQEPIADALGVTRQAVSQKYSARLAARLLAERSPAGRRGTPASATSSSPPAPRARRRPAASTSTASRQSRAEAQSRRTAAPKAK